MTILKKIEKTKSRLFLIDINGPLEFKTTTETETDLIQCIL